VEIPPTGERLATAETLAGWVRVKLRDTLPYVTTRGGGVETGIPDLDRLMQEWGATGIERVFSDGGKFRERRRGAGLHLWYDFYLGTSSPVTRALAGLAALPIVERVETIPLYRQQNSISPGPHQPITRNNDVPGYPFNDPDLQRQHHYQNFGALPHFLPGADINLFPAWEVTRGTPDVIVAVIDGGIDVHHPDLAANIWTNEAEQNGTEGVDDDGNGYIDDVHGWRFDYFNTPDTLWGSGEILPMDHATHCAGIIAAVNNNGIGGCGIAGGSGQGDGIRLMSCQTFVPDSTGDPYADSFSTRKADEAWVYAADNGAVIASCSFSSASLPAAYQAAIDYFITHAGTALDGSPNGPMQGGIVICAAGNEGNEIQRYPAAYEPCVAVAYIMPDFVVSPSSNYGSWISLVAPGGSDLPRFGPNREGAIYSTIAVGSPNGTSDGYGYKSGSSMAVPHVTGVAALVVSKFGSARPGFTADMLKTRLLQATRSIKNYNATKYHNKTGTGLLDALLALKSDEGIPPDAPSPLRVAWHTNSVDLWWIVTKDQNRLPVANYRLFWGQSPLPDLDPANPDAGISDVTLKNNLALGDTLFYTIDNIPERTQHHVALVAVDEYGNYSAPITFSGRTLNNTAPVRRDEMEFHFYFEQRRDLTIDLDDYFFDPDGDTLSYTAVSTDTRRLPVTLVDGHLLTLHPVTNGLCRVLLTATDELKAQAHGECVIMIRETALDAEFYPNPVTDLLHVRMGKEVSGPKIVRLYNAVGAKLLETSLIIRPFAPGTLDLSSFGSGAYIIVLEHNHKEIKQTLVKY
jgi:subtilisin family serine protease